MTATRCLACDIEVSHHVTADRRHLIITLAATIDTLIQEARLSHTQMRLAETKGSLAFHPDLVTFYASNHGGLNEAPVAESTGKTQWRPRDESKAPDWAKRPDPDPSGKSLWEDPKSKTRHIFTSALAQELVLKRMRRLAHIDPDQQRHSPDPGHAIRFIKSRIAKKKKKKVTAEDCNELLLSHGGYRPHSRDIFPKVQGKPVVSLLAEAYLKDPMFVLHGDGLLQSNVFGDGEADLPSYSLLIDVCRVLEAWTEIGVGLGREEQFIGTLKDFFPVHDDSEIAYLKRDWGRFGILFEKELIGFSYEQELKVEVIGGKVQSSNKYFENNTFGSDANTPTIYAWPWNLFYQPLEEIRDYFGDDVGLYFAWLDMYTRGLGLMSFYGVFVYGNQALYFDGPDENPYTLPYSIYVGVWSILFLQKWNRREVELGFLWGLTSSTHRDETRREFKNGPNATLEINPDTGRQFYVVRSWWKQVFRRFISTCCVAVLMMITVVSSTLAILVRYQDSTDITEHPEAMSNGEEDILYVDPDSSMSGDLPEYSLYHHYIYSRKYELLSAFLNLFIIVVYGMVFESCAETLTHYENHRTQEEFDDSLILKNFSFQFLNNYWALLYIAYMREIPDPFSKKPHPCEEGTCMSELQFQLLVVFSFKTVGKQIGFTLRPFVFKALKLVLANRQLNKAMSFSGTVAKGTIKKIPGGNAALELQDKIVDAGLEFTDNVLDAALGADVKIPQGVGLNKYEIQVSLMTYVGTFNDFNDRTVQFGYIVLFAPAFPLAPLLAFVNNIIEIRAAGYKLCHGYRRPTVKHRQGLGTWLVVLNTLGFLAVLMNSSMINFVGRQNARRYGIPNVPGHWSDLVDQNGVLCTTTQEFAASTGYCDESMIDSVESCFVCDGTETDSVPRLLNENLLCDPSDPVLRAQNPEPGFVPNCGSPSSPTVRKEDNSGLHGRLNIAALWLRFLGVEHLSMAVRILILFLTPNVPTWIKTARETLEFRERNVYQTNEAIEREKRYREKYEEKLNEHMEDIKDHLVAALKTESLRDMFDRLDTDGSGARRSCLACFALPCFALPCLLFTPGPPGTAC